jgi:hypothetical protein
MGTFEKRNANGYRLAVQHRQGPHKTEEALPNIIDTIDY